MSGTSATAGATVFSVSRIGDLVLATVTFDALRERYGVLRVVTSPEAAPLLRTDPRVDELDVIRSTSPLGWRASTLTRLIRSRRDGHAVVNLELYPPRWRFIRRVGGLLGLAGPAIDLPSLVAGETGAGVPPRHLASFYGEAIGLPEAPPPRLYAGEEARAEARAALEGAGLTAPGPLVVLHPGSSSGWTPKRAEPDFVAEVVRILGRRFGARVLLVGVAQEAALCAGIVRMAEAMADCATVAGGLSLGALPALLGDADLFIGNDSGPLKIAEAVGVSTVSLWTATSPDRVGPRGEGHRVIRMGEPGATPDHVARAAGELLGRAPSGPEGA